MSMRHYWGYRINTDCAKYFWNELKEGRLRQGWGFDPGQDLRNMTVDEGASRNKRMRVVVKKGDILLIPRIPEWDKVTIVEATEDWIIGYRFEIYEPYGDYGHIFPARFIKYFKRNSSAVSGEVRSSLHNPMRFWNMDYYGDSIDEIINTEQDKLDINQSYADRFGNSVVDVFGSAFNGGKFSDELFKKMCIQFKREEWEYALLAGLKLLYPAPFFRVEHTGGRSEFLHGSDIVISFRSITQESEYVIAIQVKDYDGYVADDVIAQINKAEEFFKEQNKILIDKIVIITRAEKDVNHKLIENKGDVKIIFANELKSLLSKMGRRYIAESYLNNESEE